LGTTKLKNNGMDLRQNNGNRVLCEDVCGVVYVCIVWCYMCGYVLYMCVLRRERAKRAQRSAARHRRTGGRPPGTTSPRGVEYVYCVCCVLWYACAALGCKCMLLRSCCCCCWW
jgi:hypothetical protein